jgi:hypothetical protein
MVESTHEFLAQSKRRLMRRVDARRYLEAASRSAFSLTAFFDRRANHLGKEGFDQATHLGVTRRGRRERTAVTP